MRRQLGNVDVDRAASGGNLVDWQRARSMRHACIIWIPESPTAPLPLSFKNATASSAKCRSVVDATAPAGRGDSLISQGATLACGPLPIGSGVGTWLARCPGVSLRPSRQGSPIAHRRSTTRASGAGSRRPELRRDLPRGTTRARPLIPDVRRPINRSDAHFRSGGSCGECGSSTLIRQLNRRRGQGSREPSRLPHPIEAQVARCCGPSLGGWEEARRSLLQTSSIGDPGLALWLPLRRLVVRLGATAANGRCLLFPGPDVATEAMLGQLRVNDRNGASFGCPGPFQRGGQRPWR